MAQNEQNINEENKKVQNHYYELRPSVFGIGNPNEGGKSKKEGKFTLSTVIYQKFGKGENKKKRYEKITNEINKIELNSKKEIIKLNNHIINLEKKISEEKEKNQNNNTTEEHKINLQNRMINLQTKKLALFELERDKKYNYLDVIQRLKISPDKRTVRDILRIKTYLLQSKLGQNILDEFTDKSIADRIIHFCSIEMRYQNFKKGDIVVKIGERLDSFYSIILGKINILKPMKKIVSMTGFEYFKYLMELKKNKENYIFNQCIKSNDKNYIIEISHIDIIPYIYLLNYLDYIHVNKKPAKELDDILELIDLNPLELCLDPNKFNSEGYTHDYLKTVKKKFPNISHILFDQYSFFNEYTTKNDVIVFEYKKIDTLKSNDFFGDNNFENRGPMNETIIAEEECDMAVLPNKLYSEQIASEKNILMDKKIYDLHQNHFFRQIKYGKFSKKYFKLFINEKYNKNDIIFNEGDDIKYLYFIQEGIVQLSISKSINEIEFLIDALLDKNDVILKKNKSEINLKDLTENNYSYEEIKLDNNSYIQVSNNNEELDINYLNQKQTNKLIILNSKEDIGLISLILGDKYICSCSVISNTANIYKLDKNYLRHILSHESECNEEFIDRIKNKIDLIKGRLLIISNIKLSMKGKKEIKEEPIQKDNENKKSKVLRNSNVKSSIDFDKINNLLEFKTEYNLAYKQINSSPLLQKSQIENVNLPPLNALKKKNSKILQLPIVNQSLNSKESDSNEIPKSKIIQLMKKGLMFNLNEVRKNKMINSNNSNQRIKSAKKWKIEDKMIFKIQKDINEFSNNKFNISNSNSPKKKINNIFSYSHKNSENNIYLTQLNAFKNIKPFSETEREIISNPQLKEINKNNNNINLIKKESMPLPIPIKIHTLEKIFSYSEKNKKNENENYINIKYDRYNTEENLLNFNNNKGNKKKRINHSYKNPLTLIKQEKYKIFEIKPTNNRYNIDYFSESIEKMKELKKVYSNMKHNSSTKYRNKSFK